MNKNVSEEMEWRKKVLLARYVELCSINEESKNHIKLIIKSVLQNEYNLSEEFLKKEYLNYETVIIPNIVEFLREKVNELMEEIMKKMDADNSVNTTDNHYLYHMIQEILAYDIVLGQQVLEEAEDKAGIVHLIFHNTEITEKTYKTDMYCFYLEEVETPKRSQK